MCCVLRRQRGSKAAGAASRTSESGVDASTSAAQEREPASVAAFDSEQSGDEGANEDWEIERGRARWFEDEAYERRGGEPEAAAARARWWLTESGTGGDAASTARAAVTAAALAAARVATRKLDVLQRACPHWFVTDVSARRLREGDAALERASRHGTHSAMPIGAVHAPGVGDDPLPPSPL